MNIQKTYTLIVIKFNKLVKKYLRLELIDIKNTIY